MEEIVLTLFEDGVLQRNGAVKVAKSMNAVKVPATVQAVLAARIDRLLPTIISRCRQWPSVLH